MCQRLVTVPMAKEELQQIMPIHKRFLRGITKYRDGYLKEELFGIPKEYLKSSGGIKPDEAMDYLRNELHIEIRNEVELKKYLIDLAKQKKELETIIRENKPQLLTQRETTIIKGQEKAVSEITRKFTREIQQMSEEQANVTARLERKAFSEGKKTGIESQKFHQENVETKTAVEQAFRDEVKNLATEIKDLKTQGLPIEYQDAINEIKKNIDLNTRTNKTLAKRSSLARFIIEATERGEEFNIPQEKLDMLEKIPLNEMTLGELQDVHNTIMRLYHQGKLKNELIAGVENKKFAEVVKEGVSNITQGKGLSEESSIVRVLRKQNTSLKEQSLEAVKNYVLIHLRPELLVKGLDNTEQEINTKIIWDTLYEAEQAELEEKHRTVLIIKSAFKNIDVGKAMVKQYEVGLPYKLTLNNAMFIYANTFNPQNLNGLLGSGLSETDIEKVVNFLPPEYKKAVEKIIEFYDNDQWAKINDVYLQKEGVRLNKEKGYFPKDRMEDVSYNKELEKDLLEKYHFQKAGLSKGFTKQRSKTLKGYDEFSFFDTVYRNWNKVEHYKAFEIPIRDVNKYLSNPAIKHAIKEKFGDKY